MSVMKYFFLRLACAREMRERAEKILTSRLFACYNGR